MAVERDLRIQSLGADDRACRQLRQPLPAPGRSSGRHALARRGNGRNRARACGRAGGAVHAGPGLARPRAAVPLAEPLLPVRHACRARTGDRRQRIARLCQVEAIRSWIQSNIEYRYGRATPRPTLLRRSQRGAGVCRDFASGHGTDARARIPARMVVGYLLGLDPMDLHAWFEAYVGGRWYTFDPKQADAGRSHSPRLRSRRRRRRVHLELWPPADSRNARVGRASTAARATAAGAGADRLIRNARPGYRRQSCEARDAAASYRNWRFLQAAVRARSFNRRSEGVVDFNKRLSDRKPRP